METFSYNTLPSCPCRDPKTVWGAPQAPGVRSRANKVHFQIRWGGSLLVVKEQLVTLELLVVQEQLVIPELLVFLESTPGGNKQGKLSGVETI